jgi:hypothetical protein
MSSSVGPERSNAALADPNTGFSRRGARCHRHQASHRPVAVRDDHFLTLLNRVDQRRELRLRLVDVDHAQIILFNPA